MDLPQLPRRSAELMAEFELSAAEAGRAADLEPLNALFRETIRPAGG